MKQSLKRNYFFVLFSLVSLLLYSCAEEKEFIKEVNRKVIKFEQKTLDEVLQISTFNKAYQKLVKKNAKIGNSALAKSALEEEHDFTIDPEVVKLTEAEDGTKSYNMLITRPTTTDAFFENLVIVNDTLNNVDAFIIKYIPNEQATYLPMHSSYSFEGEKEIEQIVSSGRFSTVQIGNGCFYTVLTLCYDVSSNYSAEFHVPHSPTSLCSANFIFTSTSLITCEPNETNTVYVGNGPTNPAPPTGSNMGASGSGNANTIDLTTVPPCRFNCIELDTNENLDQHNLNQQTIIADLNLKTNRAEVKGKIIQLKNETTTILMEQGTEYFTDENEVDPYIVENLPPRYSGIKFGLVFENSIIRLHSHHKDLEPIPTNEDIEGMIDFYNKKRQLEAEDAINVTSIIPTKNGIYAIRVSNPEKAKKLAVALNYGSFKNEMRLRYTLNVRKKAQTDCNCVDGLAFDQALLENFIKFLLEENTGLSIYSSTINSDGNLTWVSLP